MEQESVSTLTCDFEEEICCDLCNEVIHFHITTCPVCNISWAGTNRFSSVNECIDYYGGHFRCVECNTNFKIISYDPFAEPEAIICVIKTND